MDPSIVGDIASISGASLGLHFNDHGLVSMKTREISLNRGTFNKIGISYFSVKEIYLIPSTSLTLCYRLIEWRNCPKRTSKVKLSFT